MAKIKKQKADPEKNKETEIKERIKKELPKDAQDKFLKIKEKLDKFKDKLIDKFQDYILGISLLPPTMDKDNKPDKDKINVLVLVDDSNRKKMTEEELEEKLKNVIEKIAKDIDPSITPEIILLNALWQEAYDSKYDNIMKISTSATIYDKGMMGAIKIAAIHKTMIVKKFEKYIVTYVLAGSLVQGKATEKSDVDVFVVIDDTDVKRMSRYELKEKLRAIIIGMGIEAGEMTGIRNKLNIQIYILTDFWNSLKEANPVIFTLLRDGVPFYDRGIFMPWKQLLRMGKIKPSREAIDMFMDSGEQILTKIDSKLKDIAIEDMFYAILTPSQAALMLYGLPPPTPRETPRLMEEVFVKKEGMLEQEYIEILDKNINIRKDVEHNIKLKVEGKEIDTLLKNSKKYLNRIKKLFKEIESKKLKELSEEEYDDLILLAKRFIKIETGKKADTTENISKSLEKIKKEDSITKEELKGIKEVIKLKSSKKKDNITYEKIKDISGNLSKTLKNKIELKELKEIETRRIQFRTDSENIGEIYLMDKEAYIIKNLKDTDNIIKAELKNSNLKNPKKSTQEEFKKALNSINPGRKIVIEPSILSNLKKIIGEEYKIIL